MAYANINPKWKEKKMPYEEVVTSDPESEVKRTLLDLWTEGRPYILLEPTIEDNTVVTTMTTNATNQDTEALILILETSLNNLREAKEQANV